MNSMGIPASHPSIPVDIKDPRIRVTFADVAMRIAHDGPMYGVIVLVGVLALNKQLESIHAIFGAAFALQARSRPPDLMSKALGSGTLAITGIFIAAAFVSHFLTGCK